MSENDWYYEYVVGMYSANLMLGVSKSEFAPDDTLTRAMFVTILYRAAGSPDSGECKFVDVADDMWYTSAIAWAAANGIVNGESDTEFAPDSTITREQAAAIMLRYAANNGDTIDNEKADISAYSDSEMISDYAVDGICYVVSAGIMNGKTDTMFNPLDNMTRAETAAVVMRMLNK